MQGGGGGGPKGPTGVPLNSSYQSRDSPAYKTDLGLALVRHPPSEQPPGRTCLPFLAISERRVCVKPHNSRPDVRCHALTPSQRKPSSVILGTEEQHASGAAAAQQSSTEVYGFLLAPSLCRSAPPPR